jgi:hypothetical protein
MIMIYDTTTFLGEYIISATPFLFRHTLYIITATHWYSKTYQNFGQLLHCELWPHHS